MSSRNFKTPANRHQNALLPPSLDEYVNADNHVRAIDCYVENVDLAELGFKNASGGLTSGQPAYHPKELAKLYIYGYLHKARSSRHLADESCRNLELMWLLGNLHPSHATIANFRKNNAVALVALNKDFFSLCKGMNLFDANSIAIDGAFFSGNASKGSITSKNTLNKQIKALEADIVQWQEKLEACDQIEGAQAPSRDERKGLSETLDALKIKMNKKKELSQKITDSNETQICSTDPDARLLHKRGQSVSGYNVQIAVDDKYKLLAASSVTNAGNDSYQLVPMSLQAKANLGVDKINSYADAGYNETGQFKTCEDEGITAYVPLPDYMRQFKASGRYSRNDFIYDADNKTYTCPNDIVIEQAKKPRMKRGKKQFLFLTKHSICKECRLKDSCLNPGTKIREIYRWEHEDVLDRHRQRMLDNPNAMKKRSGLAEHPFGTLKRRAGWDHFLVRGFEKVRGEWSLMAMCYNWTRAINILGMDTFMAACANRDA